MIRHLLRHLGIAKTCILIASACMILSFVLYLSSAILFEEVTPRGILTSLLIPIVIAPAPSFLILRVILQLDLSRARLKESEERYRNILESIEEGYFENDLQGNIVFVNDAASRISGYARDELIGMNNRDYTTPETAKNVFGVFNHVYQSLKPAYVQDYEIIRKDGARRTLELSASAIVGDDGRPIGFRGVGRDVTEHRQAEKALKENEEKYRALYEDSMRAQELYRSLLHSSADAIILYDLEGNATYVSPAFTQIFGWTLEEVKGRRIHFLPDSEKERTMAGIRQIMGEGKAIQGFETKRYAKDGRIIEVSISGSRYCDHRGVPAGMLVILRDISEKKKLEAQLQQAQKIEAIGTLAGGIAHDFNNLLMAIQGNVSLMLFDLHPSHPHYDRLVGIEKQVKSGAKLSAQLLGYARKGKYEARPIDLNRLVEETSEAFGRARREVTIRRDLARDLSAVEADPGQVEQVLFNLFVNAADAMPGGGELRLRTADTTHEHLSKTLYGPKPGRYVLLEVQDTGTGMDRDTLDRIFDPFFTTKALGRGTGLGLASVYGIVKNHGGYITVESQKGAGSTFRIYFPASSRGTENSVEASKPIHEGHETILLVDDEEMVLEVAAEMMGNLGYTTLQARSGQEALEIYRTRKDDIDLVVLDMIMPQMGGGEVYDRLREINPDVKVLLSSGYSAAGQASDILGRGCSGFIQKPYSVADLSGRLNKILRASMVPPKVMNA